MRQSCYGHFGISRVSVGFLLGVILCVLINVMLAYLFPLEEVCKCSGSECCTEDNSCGDRCLCVIEGQSSCRDKEVRYDTIPSIIRTSIFLIGVGLLISAVTACCCFGRSSVPDQSDVVVHALPMDREMHRQYVRDIPMMTVTISDGEVDSPPIRKSPEKGAE